MLYALQELEELLGMGNGNDGDGSSTGTSRTEVVLGAFSCHNSIWESSSTGLGFTFRF